MKDTRKIIGAVKRKKFKILDIILIITFILLYCIITYQKIANEELSQESEMLNKSLGAAQAGRWLYKIDEDQLIWDDGMYKLFNAPRQKDLKLSDFTNRLYEKDKERIIDIMNGVMNNNTTYYARYRAVG
jgi:two-component system, sensor histidine kinase and response regulator